MNMKKVTIIIPCYNAEKYVNYCIESALNQSYPNIEIIIVNDGSPDNSLNIITQFNNRGRVKIINQSNKGAATARNTGLSYATGDYIQFLDADDVLDPYKIEVQIDFYKKNNWNKENLVFGKWTTLGKDITLMGANQKSVWHNYLNPTDILNDFVLTGCCLPPLVYLPPKSLIERAGNWNEKLSMNDDGEFFARILSVASSLHYCDDAISYYRSTPNSLSKRMSHKAALSQIQSQILIAEIMENNPNEKTKEAIYKMINESLRKLYPYYKQERIAGEEYLIHHFKMRPKYPSLNWKEWICYLMYPSLH